MTTKITICGAGYIADIHAQAIQSLPETEIAAVVEQFPEKAKAFAQKFNIPAIYTTLDEMLLHTRVDAVIIGTPNFLHAPQALTALKAGIGVMVEKPMAISVDEAKAMHAMSQKTGAVLMVAHCWRFDTEALWLKAQAQSGKLGKIIRTKGYGVHANWGPSGWFTQKKFAAGGAMADMGIHALDTARFLLGDPQPVSVYAHIGTYYTNYDVDDTGIVIVNWSNGTVSYLESGWWQPHMDGPEAATQLYGTAGFGSLFPTRLELPNRAFNTVEVLDSGFSFPRASQCSQDMYNRQMACFIEAVRSGKTPTPGGLEGLTNMRVVEAAYRSAATGQVVEVKEE